MKSARAWFACLSGRGLKGEHGGFLKAFVSGKNPTSFQILGHRRMVAEPQPAAPPPHGIRLRRHRPASRRQYFDRLDGGRSVLVETSRYDSGFFLGGSS